MSSYVILCHLMSSYVILCHLMSSYVIMCSLKAYFPRFTFELLGKPAAFGSQYIPYFLQALTMVMFWKSTSQLGTFRIIDPRA